MKNQDNSTELGKLRIGSRFTVQGRYFKVSGKLLDKSGGSAVVLYDGDTNRIHISLGTPVHTNNKGDKGASWKELEAIEALA